MKKILFFLVFCVLAQPRMMAAEPTWTICFAKGELSVYKTGRRTWKKVSAKDMNRLKLCAKDSLSVEKEVALESAKKKVFLGKTGKWSVQDILDGKAFTSPKKSDSSSENADISHEFHISTGDNERETGIPKSCMGDFTFQLFREDGQSVCDFHTGESLFAVTENLGSRALYAAVFWVEYISGKIVSMKNILSCKESMPLPPNRLTVLQPDAEHPFVIRADGRDVPYEATIYCIYDKTPFVIPDTATLDDLRNYRHFCPITINVTE